MSRKSKQTEEPWVDPDDAPEWTDEMFARAALRRDGKEVRAASGTITRPGRPPLDNPKKQITLRLDPDVIDKFRKTGRGWHTRINEALREALGI